MLIIKKDSGIIPQILTEILDDCVNGVTLADPDLEDCPLIYANKAFEKLTGYSQSEIIGHNCRFLQAKDTEQDSIKAIKRSIENRTELTTTLRNYKKDGTLFYNRLKIKPLFDNKGNIMYFLGLQYDVTYQVNAENEINRLNSLI
jgi:PAS domain S-box-containing protein